MPAGQPKTPCANCSSLNVAMTRQLVTFQREGERQLLGPNPQPVETTTYYRCADCGCTFTVKVEGC